MIGTSSHWDFPSHLESELVYGCSLKGGIPIAAQVDGATDSDISEPSSRRVTQMEKIWRKI